MAGGVDRMDAVATWVPRILGKDRLDERRWVLAVEAPFDMPSDIPDLIGIRVQLVDHKYDVRGTIPRMPPFPVKKGEALALLVVDATGPLTLAR
jgi:hypothetical protein